MSPRSSPGYSLAEADNLRKAMGKKSREVMAKEPGPRSRTAAERCGYGQELGKQLFDVIEKFADYAFNKSHTFGYGLVTYQTAYLKAHYPVEYLACLLIEREEQPRQGRHLPVRRAQRHGHQGADARHQPLRHRLRHRDTRGSRRPR